MGQIVRRAISDASIAIYCTGGRDHYLRIVRALLFRAVDGEFVFKEPIPVAIFAAVTLSVSLLTWLRSIA
jgi:hypothetical protein